MVTLGAFRAAFEVKMTWGGANKFKALWDALTQSVHEELKEHAQGLAESLGEDVRRYVSMQPGSWPPLRAAYRMSKIRRGLDPRMLLATHEYVNSIGLQWIKESGDGLEVYVGVPNVDHSDARMPMAQLGRIHEYGSSNIPSRPHWGPVWRRWLPRSKQDVMDMLENLEETVAEKINKGWSRGDLSTAQPW